MPCTRTVLLLAATLAGPALAAPSIPGAGAVAAEERSPFIGRWELDLTRMPVTYGTPPRRVLYAFRDLGNGKWLATIDITAGNGTVRHMELRFARDGRAAHSRGDLSEGDSAAVGSPADRVLVMSIAQDRSLASVRTYAVSADGDAMIESAADVDANGTPFVRNFHFKRVG